MARILVADDDRRLTDTLAEGLRLEGHVVEVVHDGREAVIAVGADEPDVIVLDIQMPVLNGYQVVERLRADGVGAPILMLTAKDGEYDEAEGLDTGADDYLTKPFSYVVLLARLRVLLRRPVADSAPTVTVGTLTVDPVARTAMRGGVQILLTGKEFAVLHALARARGRPVGKAALAATVWEDGLDGYLNRLEAHISALRRKIDAPFGVRQIETLRGHGYRLRADR